MDSETSNNKQGLDIRHLLAPSKAKIKKIGLKARDVASLFFLQHGEDIGAVRIHSLFRDGAYRPTPLLKERAERVAVALCIESQAWANLEEDAQALHAAIFDQFLEDFRYAKAQAKENAIARLRAQQMERRAKLKAVGETLTANWGKTIRKAKETRAAIIKTPENGRPEIQANDCACDSIRYIEFQSHKVGLCTAIGDNPNPCKCPKKQACKACGKMVKP